MTEGIQSPCNQPGGRVAREDDPPRLDFFPLPFAAAFFTRSAAAVLSFAIVSSEISAERRRRDCSGERGGSLRRKGEEKQGRTVEKIWIIALYKATPEWLISGPVPPVKSRSRRTHGTWRKRWRGDRGALALSSRFARFSPSGALPNFRIP